MDYEKIYYQIIERAKSRKLEGYKEKHHIIPKCMSGSNKKENLVELTAREHFLCHMLLVEIYPDNKKLKYAMWLMSTGWRRSKSSISYNFSNRIYEINKNNHCQLMKGNKYRSGKITTEETKLKQSLSHIGKKDSDETKLKKSQIKLGHTKNEQWRKNLSISSSKSFGRPIIQKDLLGNIIKEWETGKKAANDLGLNYAAINLCCLQNEKNIPMKRDKSKIGKHISFNYIWEYKTIKQKQII